MTGKKVLFVTGTRADFGKLKSLAIALKKTELFSVNFFVTGMHMLSKYGNTWFEVEKSGAGPFHNFFNQRAGDSMDEILAKTITGLSDFLSENSQDLIVVHGDRVEALAAAIVGALNNVPVAHVEGGELSGTIDESLRHAISKLSLLHFVANDEAAQRLEQLGEANQSIFIIGSPDIDIMDSPDLPSLDEVTDHYGLNKSDYCILVLHPVTTDISETAVAAKNIMAALEDIDLEVIVIMPNNDAGSALIEEQFLEYYDREKFHFFPSIRFEYFLTLLKNANFIVGNSSAGIREAPYFGVPAVNIGTRQMNRAKSGLIINSASDALAIRDAIARVEGIKRVPQKMFGHGNSAQRFSKILSESGSWPETTQKVFVNRNSQS